MGLVEDGAREAEELLAREDARSGPPRGSRDVYGGPDLVMDVFSPNAPNPCPAWRVQSRNGRVQPDRSLDSTVE
jgi:hypothetical protein